MHDVTRRTFASQRLLRLLLALLVAVAVSAVFATPARAQAHPPTGHPIADGALKHVGQHGGQCFTFMKMAVETYGGLDMGWGYRGAYESVGAYEVSSANARAGDIIQLADDSRDNGSYPGLHTAIILDNHGGGRFTVVDSNRNWNEMVQVHEYEPWGPWGASRYSHITVRIWRIPLDSATTPTPTPAPEPETVYEAGDIAKVDTGGDNLNLRPSPGTTESPINQLSHGSQVVIVSGDTVTAAGYTWIQVDSPVGTGWVATEFLRLHSRAEDNAGGDGGGSGGSGGASGLEDPFGGEPAPFRIAVPGLAND